MYPLNIEMRDGKDKSLSFIFMKVVHRLAHLATIAKQEVGSSRRVLVSVLDRRLVNLELCVWLGWCTE